MINSFIFLLLLNCFLTNNTEFHSSRCLQMDSQQQHCETCITGLSLVDGDCLIPNCLIYSLPNVCSKCELPFTLNNNACQITSQTSNCPSGQTLTAAGICALQNCVTADIPCSSCLQGYSVTTSGTCMPEIANCQIPNQAGCNICITNYKFVNEQCVLASALPWNCQTYKPDFSCAKCIDGFVLEASTVNCIPEVSAIKNCRNYTRAYDCAACNQGFQGPRCTPLIQNCLIYNGIQCSKCLAGYTLIQQRCINSKSVVSKCRHYSDKSKCISCETNYQLLNNSCVSIPKIQNCVFYDLSLCAQCQINYTLFNNFCIPNSQVVLNCVKYNSTACLSCKSSTTLFNNMCVPTIDLVQFCRSYTPDYQCSSCEKGMFLVNNNTLCLQRIVNNCQYYINRACSNCSISFTLFSGMCISNQSFVTNCQNYDSKLTSCLMCQDGFNLFRNMCVPQTKIRMYCTQYDQSFNCISCQFNYTLMKGQCLLNTPFVVSTPAKCPQGYIIVNGKCAPARDKNCIKFDIKNNCIDCPRGFYLNNNTCKLVDSNCKLYSSIGKCLTCYQNWYLNAQGMCTTSPCIKTDPNNNCIKCASDYQLLNSVCHDRKSFCKNLSKADNTTCYECYLGYTLKGGRCYYYQSIDPFCILQDDNNNCLRCQDRYYISEGVCTAVSNSCVDYDLYTGGCVSCYQGYTPVMQKCVYIPGGIDENCIDYSLEGRCLTCVTGYKLNGIKCVK